jgi:hypothetical protein
MIVPVGGFFGLVTRVLNLEDSPRALLVVSGVTTAAVLAFFLGGPNMMVLVLGASVLLLAILALWNSVRSLTGELDVDPELIQAQNKFVSDRAAEKERVLRALKDLENERDIGKLDEADFKAVSARYREEAKDLLREMDAEVAPHREKAEELAAKYVKKHLDEAPVATEPGASETKSEKTDAPSEVTHKVCPACNVKNDADAKFCKSCAASMTKKSADNDEKAGTT